MSKTYYFSKEMMDGTVQKRIATSPKLIARLKKAKWKEEKMPEAAKLSKATKASIAAAPAKQKAYDEALKAAAAKK